MVSNFDLQCVNESMPNARHGKGPLPGLSALSRAITEQEAYDVLQRYSVLRFQCPHWLVRCGPPFGARTFELNLAVIPIPVPNFTG